jgi:endonuclease/exonuclease/phosphatase (EEP) superfamily protein YafD
LTTLIAAAGLGPFFDPAERPGEGRPLTLLYANLHDRNPEPAALAAMLRAIDADILITSETSRAVVEGAGGLAAAYPYRLVHSGAGEALRTAIWSKYPLRGGVLYLNNTVAPTAAAAIADLGDGTKLGLIGAHFSRPFERLHQVQAAALGPMADRLGHPLIVAGDFNAAPWSRVVARAAEVTGSDVLGGYRVTWKGRYRTPLGLLPEPWGHQIDQILLSAGIGVETVETLDLPGSDHLGLLVRLRIPAP